MAAVNLVHEEPLGEDNIVQGIGGSWKQNRPLSEWDPSPLGRSNSITNVSRQPTLIPNLSRRATSESDKAKTKGEQIKAAEVVYYTARLKEYYDRSDNDVASSVASGQKRKYLDQLKGQLKLGEKEQPKAVVPYDPTGIKKKLKSLGKEDLMELVVNMAKKLEEAGKSTEIQRLLDIALSAPTAKPTVGLTGIDRLLEDGLLAFLVKIRQHLPRFPPQLQCR